MAILKQFRKKTFLTFGYLKFLAYICKPLRETIYS